MAEYSINPYGQTAELPEGYPIKDDLKTDSAQWALSARQGKRLKEMIDAKADGDVTIKRYAVNLCNPGKMESGKVLGDSGAVASGSGIVTDYIPIEVSYSENGITQTFKTQYIQVCASIPLTNPFGYCAAKVCAYDADKTYMGAISNVSSIVDKESQANAEVFTKEVTSGGTTTTIKAAYIRVQFAAGTTYHYVALSNKPVLPQYSPYNKDDLTAPADWMASKIHNTDGAISNMLETALSYMGIVGNGKTLGYGDSATAYDTSCEPVSADPWVLEYAPNVYSGEMKQINCSCFVQLCLEGVRYSNSRYVLGSSADNVGINGYVFDDKVETNYHNTHPDRVIPCSTYNKFYANRQMKYAESHGFAFLIESGFRNIEVGDIIFNCTSTSSMYKKITHVLFVSGVTLKSDGTKVLTTMEVIESGAKEENNVTAQPNGSKWIYAARFPLPCIESKAKNIVSGINPPVTAFSSLNSGVTQVIGTLSLSENVKAKGVYTVVVKCSSVGDFEVMVGTMSDDTFTALGTNGEDLLRRGDGVTVKHFNLHTGSSINTNSLTVAIKTYAALSSNVEIVDAKVFNGYVTE